MTNYIRKYATYFCTVLFSSSVLASSLLLVQDAENTYQLPKKFRSTSHLVPGNYEHLGLKDLHIMGSAQFSEQNLNFVLAHYPKPSYIFDLRQESHGFLNGIAISWYGKNNWANINKTQQENLRTENTLLASLTAQKEMIIHKVTQKKGSAIEASVPIKIEVNKAFDEQQLAQKNNIHYVRIGIPDHHQPTSEQVNEFIKVVRTIPKTDWMYFHCRGGMGRTTTFMAMADMMANAKKLTLEQILIRQSLMGGQDLIKKSSSRNKLLGPLGYQRLQFLKKFYTYSRNNKDNFQTGWVE